MSSGAATVIDDTLCGVFFKNANNIESRMQKYALSSNSVKKILKFAFF